MKYLAIAFISLFTLKAQAALITTFTNQASFLTAAGSTSSYNFDANSAGGFSNQDFGDFSVVAAGSGIRLSVLGGASSSTFSSNHLDFNTACCNIPDTMTITFNNGLLAFGFDFSNEDPTSDYTVLTVDGQSFNVGSSGTSGFFGLVTDTALSSFVFQDDPSNGGANTSTKFDNFLFASNSNDVPEPATLLLFGLGLVGLRFSNIKSKAV
jgi:hypothetical protein